MADNYTKKLEEVIKQMLRPLKNIPFNLVIEGLAGHQIIPFNKKDKKDLELLEKLSQAARMVGVKLNKSGIRRPRPNEVGNDVEAYVKEALGLLGFSPRTPLTTGGGKKSTGYPDIEFLDENGRINYLECKTFNVESVGTTMRSFYLSPSENFKITADAHHFVVSFEIYVDGRSGQNNIYKCRSWKLLTVENLEVDVKYEFNSDNMRLYAKEHVLAEEIL